MIRRIAIVVFAGAVLSACDGDDQVASSTAPTREPDPTGDRFLALVDSVDFDREAEEIAAMRAGDRALYVLYSVDGEINNGGFSQLLSNTTAALYQDAIVAARLVGAREAEAVLSQLPSALGLKTIPRDRAEVERIAEALTTSQGKRLSALDDQWYDRVGSEITEHMAAYYGAHPEAFGFRE